MLEVRVFKFKAENDIVSHLKPHFYLNWEFDSIADLLADIAQSDYSFNPKNGGWVKVNGVVCPTSTKLALVANKFKNELYITPLDEFRAYDDLNYNSEAFWQVFDSFKRALAKAGAKLDDKHRASFSKLEPLFYASPLRAFGYEFMGEASLVFARYLIKQMPEQESTIVKHIASPAGVWSCMDLSLFIMGQASGIYGEFDSFANEALSALKWAKELIAHKPAPNISDESYTGTINVTERFKDFGAVYYGSGCEINGLELFEIASKNLPSGFEFIANNKALAIALASQILFEAFDSGADFLIVDNEKDFYMFDTLAKECQKHTNRAIENFYVLRASELAGLNAGWEVPELANHKLKVLL